MESVSQKVLQIGGASLLAAAAYYTWSKASDLNKKSATARELSETPVLFFNDASSQCYMNLNHKVDDCPLASQCPCRHIRTIVRLLGRAQKSVDVCLFNLTHPDLENAIINVLRRKKKVRCVAGGHNREFVTRLRSEGAFLVEKSTRPPPGLVFSQPVSELLMHHKFVIIDDTIVITGSMNWTNTSFNRHWDHIIIDVDKHLVKQFIDEFEYLYSETSENERAYYKRPEDLPIQACFFRRAGISCRADANRKKKCEREDCMFTLYRSILYRIGAAKSSIDICAQQITLEDYANELVFVHDMGVKIRVACDKRYVGGTGSQIPYLMKAGISVRMQEGSGVLHHKFIIIDGKTLLTGSLNWTMQSFYGNYENLLIIKKKDIVDKFQKEFNRVWDFFSSDQLHNE